MPSVKEGWPYTLLEALNAGLPIIATEVGGIPEIITNQKNGLLIPPADPQGLTSAIKKLINNSILISKLKKNSLISSRKFTLKTALAKTLGLYK